VHLVPGRYAAGPSPLAGLYFTDWHEDAALIRSLHRCRPSMP
jgi:hypothetical protein